MLSACYVKAATNLAVCYEKLGHREKALKICKDLRNHGVIMDSKLNNNMGVLYKRDNEMEKAMECYRNALSGGGES